MAAFKAVRAVIIMDFSRWKTDLRIWFIFVFTAVLLFYYVSPLTSCGLDTGRRMTMCLLPVLFHSDTISLGSPKILFHIGMLLIFCDAPFFYPGKPYLILRSGKENWSMGECLYIIAAAFVYLSFITLAAALIALPIAEMKDTWNGVLTDIAFGTAERSREQMTVLWPQHMILPRQTLSYLYPSGSQLYTFLVVWGSFSMMGLLQYLVSLMTKKMLAGIAAAGSFVFIDPILAWAAWPNRYWLLAFSPVCWTSIEQLNLLGTEHFISIPFVTVSSLVLLAALFVSLRGAGQQTALGGFRDLGGIADG